MRDSFSGIFLFNIVFAFILLFAGIMSLTMNRSKAFAVKNELVNLIEKNKGIDLTKASIPTEMVSAIAREAYRTVGKCPEGFHGFDREGRKNNSAPSICIKTVSHFADLGLPDGSFSQADVVKSCHFQIVVFYKLDFPALREVFSFNLVGDTIEIHSDHC